MSDVETPNTHYLNLYKIFPHHDFCGGFDVASQHTGDKCSGLLCRGGDKPVDRTSEL